TWFVNSASHTWGYKNFKINDLSTNCWWVALLSYGEGWHNNHHAFPTSARHGMKPWEIDFSYYFIKMLKWVGLAWEVHVPSTEAMKKKVVDAAGDLRPRAAVLHGHICIAGHNYLFLRCAKRRQTPRSPAISICCAPATSANWRRGSTPIYSWAIGRC